MVNITHQQPLEGVLFSVISGAPCAQLPVKLCCFFLHILALTVVKQHRQEIFNKINNCYYTEISIADDVLLELILD